MGIKYIWSWDYFLYDDHQNISPNDEKIANFWNNYVKEHGMINPKWYVIFSSDDYDNNIKPWLSSQTFKYVSHNRSIILDNDNALALVKLVWK